MTLCVCIQEVKVTVVNVLVFFFRDEFVKSSYKFLVLSIGLVDTTLMKTS